MKRVALVHYQPPELYPPLMNFLECAKDLDAPAEVDVYTTYCYAAIRPYQPVSPGIIVHRLGSKEQKISAAGRAFHYARFYLLTLWWLIRTRPSVVFYFETFSSFPAYIYKRYFNRKSRLFIHYHEYMTPREYEGGMLLIKWFHKLEKKIYKSASWISHTNELRMQRFVSDMKGIALPDRSILPNYPPRHWRPIQKDSSGIPLKTVYIGAFSLETMYIKEFANWVVGQNGKVTWDIYSLNMTEDATGFIHSLPGNLINIHPGIEYYDLPAILGKYDVGVILYTGHIPNWIDNAPNKLFEYWSAGLDVWLPMQMKGSLEFVTTNTYPRIIAVDFQKLDSFDGKSATDKTGLKFEASPFYSEKVYMPLWRLVLKN